MSTFRSKHSVRWALGSLLIAWVLMLGLVGTDASAFLQKSPEPNTGGTGCHCGEKNCGCAAPTAGCTLKASCSCPSSGECTQTCEYFCA